ncbi:hypothetical protein CRUP_018500, partial [Coryphaenoides rupestris]
MVGAELGNLEIVQELIKRGANVNLDDVDCWTALISAAREGHLEVVRELLENNANLEHRDMGGWSALMWAAYKGRTPVAQMLLEKGANPNITGQYSVYPIIWAAGRGHADIVHLLLQHGAKVNCSDKYGTTPLIWAARKGHYDSVMHLLANGADNSMTALIVAVKGGFTDVVKELLKRNPNVNMTDKDGNTALAIAAKEGHTEIVQDLLDAGTYVNIPDRSGETMLIGAVRGGHVDIVRALLLKYADIDVRGQDGKTALYWAVEKGNATMVRDILQCNPDTESCTKEAETPLIKATKMRNMEIVELLLDKVAKVSAVDKKGDTPLHIAIRGRSRKLAELLLRNPKDGRLLLGHVGYDLYSSALADILSEPTMQPPICVGLYAQWGSGKSFLLKKLEDEMKTFAGQQVEPLFQLSWLVVFLTLLLCGSVALCWCTSAAVERARAGTGRGFLFTDYNRLSSVGGETSMAEMVATLSDACEREFGFMATRLFRVFKNDEIQGKKWKKTCCVPSFVLFALTVGCLITGIALLAIFKVDPDNLTVNAVLIAMASVVGLALLLNCKTWWQVADSVLNSQRKRLHSAANNLHTLKSEGFMKNQTRMAVIIDGLDACEQDRVLQMLDTAINQNLNSVLRDSNINGHDYMRNIVHLPDTYRRRQMQRTLTRQMSFDLTKLLVTEDWFSDISPQTMRRLLNIVSVTGRLLRANQIIFNWDRLASWINLTEEWPYRTSWIILFLEETDGVSDQVTLKTIYDRISKNIPTTKDVEPLLEIDGDSRSFEVFLSSRTPVLTTRDVDTFLPCTVNLDPKLREIIA